ncbi:hypothetical protein EU527_05310, partial [Candidatus Thorarchaeota archaeon]
YDMTFYTAGFYSNDVDWLAYEYWSEYADVPNQNPTNFVNVTYDSWRDQLLYGTTYEEVYEAAAEMQKILHYNVPRLVVYVNTYLQAYRTNQFTGHIEDLDNYIAGPWTMRKIHKLDGTFGGVVQVAISEAVNSFNFFKTQWSISANYYLFSEFWPSLYKYDPHITPWPDLADEMLIETHSDNTAVPDGHVRFTINIIQNATWSDGVPLTAQDVAFSYNYALQSEMYGNPAGSDLDQLVGVYSPSTYQVVFEFNSESFWHFSDFAFDCIIPEHIFNDDDGIGYEGWYTWNPIFNESHPFVTCGPFIFSDFENNDYYEIMRNPLFHYGVFPSSGTINVTTSTTTTTSSTTTVQQITNPVLNWSLIFSSILGSGSAIVILYCTVVIVRKRKTTIENSSSNIFMIIKITI